MRWWKSVKSPKRRFSKSDTLAHALPIMAATAPRLVMSIWSEHTVQSHRNMCHFGCLFSTTTFTHIPPECIGVHTRPTILYTDLDRLLPKVKFNACNRETRHSTPHTYRLDSTVSILTCLATSFRHTFVTHEWDMNMNTSNLARSRFFLPSPQSMEPCMGPSDPTTRGKFWDGFLRNQLDRLLVWAPIVSLHIQLDRLLVWAQ